jgi:hypothetical protein
MKGGARDIKAASEAQVLYLWERKRPFLKLGWFPAGLSFMILTPLEGSVGKRKFLRSQLVKPFQLYVILPTVITWWFLFGYSWCVYGTNKNYNKPLLMPFFPISWFIADTYEKCLLQPILILVPFFGVTVGTTYRWYFFGTWNSLTSHWPTW